MPILPLRAPLARVRLAGPLLAAACLAVAAGCGKDVGAAASARAEQAGAPPDVPAAVAAIATPGAPYRAVAVANPGAVRGTVLATGVVPVDTTVRPGPQDAGCGPQVVDPSTQLSAGRVMGAVVWLVGVRAGKSLPLQKRYELLNEHCRLAPRVQAAVVGGTLNVRSADRQVHHLERFRRQAAGTPVVGVAETNDAGQVVPLEGVLRAPGAVEIRCDSHAWTRGWLFAFDHPYFAVTAGDGSFTLDGVPPGRYTLVAWHERLGVVEQAVTVQGGQSGAVELKLGASE